MKLLLIVAILISLSFNSRGDRTSDCETLDSETLIEDERKKDSFRVSLPFSGQIQEEYPKNYEEENVQLSVEDLANSDLSNEEPDFDLPALNDKLLTKHLVHRFLKIYQKRYSDDEDNFQDENLTSNQELPRRHINDWRAADEFYDPSSIASNMNINFPKMDYHNIRNDYLDEPSYSSGLHQNKSLPGEPEGLASPSYPVEQPQYFQKNYYYNYYPSIKDQKITAPKWSDNKIYNSEEVIRKDRFRGKKPRKNPCKQYLEFLRYAFRELDENPDYNYDYSEEYNNDWRIIESQKGYESISTQMHGPTLYVDNSVKVPPMTSEESSVQMITGVSPSSKVSVTTMKPVFTSPATFSQGLSSSTVAPKYSSNVDSNDSFIYDSDKTESTTINNPKKYEPHTPKFGMIKSRNLTPWASTEVEYLTTPRTDSNDRTTIYDYDYGDTTSISTLPSHRYASGDHYVTTGNSFEGALSNSNFGKSNSSVGSPLHWHTRTSTSLPLIPSAVNNIKSRTMITFDDKNEFSSKEDCNDKMLPCPDTVNITYPLNGYCNRYVSCEFGKAIRRTCPNGLHFNLITKSCDFPHNSFCTYVCPESNGYFGIPGDCNGYFICKNFVPEYRMCPPKMQWDITKNICTFEDLPSCPMKCSKPNEVKHYDGDCKAYVICLNGYPFYHKCPPNKKFDSHTHSCVPNDQSTCEDDPRLMTKNLNPNNLCRDIDMKLGTKVWCQYFHPTEDQKK